MIKTLHRLLESETVRYAAAGAATTLVNFLAFALINLTPMHYLAANTLSFFLAAAFAYFANERFVFRIRTGPWTAAFRRWVQFMVMRAASFAADMGLMALLVSVLSLNALLSKIAVNAVVIVINYLVSKFHIFKKEIGT